MTSFVGSVRGIVSPIWSSLTQTVSALIGALRRRSGTDVIALIKEGSPLERLVESLLSAAFWVLALMPFLLVPIYYLVLSLK